MLIKIFHFSSAVDTSSVLLLLDSISNESVRVVIHEPIPKILGLIALMLLLYFESVRVVAIIIYTRM